MRKRTILKSDVIGKRFGRWIVNQSAGVSERSQFLFFCTCDCGQTRIVVGHDLIRGKSKSCGCFSRDETKRRLTTHNLSGSKIYWIWLAIKDRCHNKNKAGYKNYGGRGIIVCPSWEKSFEQFYEDMKKGYKPHLTIDRIDNDSPYCPFNCRWVTRQDNYLNSSRIKRITINSITKTLTEWLAHFKMARATYGNRVYHCGWPPEKALTTPGTQCTKYVWHISL